MGDADVAVAVDVPGGAPQAGGAGACRVVVNDAQEARTTTPGDAFDVVFAEGAAEDRFIALVLVGAAQFPHDVQIARVHNRVCGCFLQLGHAVEALGGEASTAPFDLDGELEVAIDDVVAAIALDRVGAAAAQQDVAEGQGAGSGRSGEQVGAGQQGVVDQGAIQGHVGAEQAADLGELVLGEAVVEGVDHHSGEGWLQVSAAVTQDEVVKAGARNSFCVGVEGVANDQVGLRVDRGDGTEIDLPGGDIATEDHPVEAVVTGVAVVASAIDEDVVAEFAVTAVIAVPEHDHIVAVLLAVATSDGQTGVDIQHQAAAVLTDHSVSTAASLEPVVANAAHGGAAAAAQEYEVVAFSGEHFRGRGTTDHEVVAVAAEHDRQTSAEADYVVAVFAADHIASCASAAVEDDVVAGTAEGEVVATAGVDAVVATIAVDGVIAIAGR